MILNKQPTTKPSREYLDENQFTVSLRWVNQDLEKMPDEPVEKCHTVTTCNITVTSSICNLCICICICVFVPHSVHVQHRGDLPHIFNFQTVDETRTRQVPKRVCEDVQKRRRECKSEQVQQPPYVSNLFYLMFSDGSVLYVF